MINIKQRLEGVFDHATAYQLLLALFSLHNSQVLSAFGLNFAATAAVGRTSATAAGWALVNGVTVKVAAATALPALTGVNLVSGQRVVVSYFVDNAGTITQAVGDLQTSNANLRFPAPMAPTVVCIGYLIIEAAATFTGGTTALDAASITSTFISNVGGTPAVSIL